MPDKADERILQPCSLANAGSQTSIVFAMPDQDPRLLDMHGLPPSAVAAPLFLLYFQAALWRRWNADMRHMPRCEDAACSPQRAAASSIARLQPLRKRLRHRQIIQETWEAIARKRSRTTIPVEKCVENTAVPALSQRKPVHEYIRPHCKTQVRSTVTDGQVDAKQQHCGVRFRVRSGTVIQSFFTHQCPSCLTEVQSTKRFGRIQVAHKKSNGKRCATKCWRVVCSGTKDMT